MAHKEFDIRQTVRRATIGLATGVVLAGAVAGCSELRSTGDSKVGSEDPIVQPSGETGAGLGNQEPNITGIAGIESAVQNGDGWTLNNPDGQEVSINLPAGFTPDQDLIVQNDLQVNAFKDFPVYQDWDSVIHEVAGYNYDENDFSGNVDFLENVQGDMYAWRVIQGEEVAIPGIGHLKGGEGTSVVVLVLNLQPNVIPWDKDGLGPVFCKHGFTATGRIWDAGTPEKIAETEELLGGHWLFRQEAGTPEKSYIGVTDDPDNAKQTLYVSVVNRQWGNNEDGTPREQFQLLRADLVTFNK